jgi:hypothetical protein
MPDCRPTSPSTPPVTPVTLASLAATYPGWQLDVTELGYSAEHRSQSGRSIRYIAATNLDDLAAKLAVAKTVEP